MTRTKMPKRRQSQHYQLAIRLDHDGSLITAHVTLSPIDDEGRLGEVWVDFGGKHGSPISVAMAAWAKAVSLALQHGAHPHHLVHSFEGIREWRGHDTDTNEEVLSLYDAVAKLIRSETDTEGRLL